MPAEFALAGDPECAPRARRALVEVLEGWGLTSLEFAASLLLGELVANAVLHAKTEIMVAVHRTDAGVRLEVADRSARVPQPRHYGEGATTGRGLALVAALSEAWGVQPTSDGKLVWCDITDASAARPFTPGEHELDIAPDLDDFPDLDDGPERNTELPPSSLNSVASGASGCVGVLAA